MTLTPRVEACDLFPDIDEATIRRLDRPGPRYTSYPTVPVWSERFGPPSGATAAATLYARRRLEMLASYIASLQR